jgi:dihydroorotase
MSFPTQGLIVRGASLLGEKTADLYVDNGVLVAEEPKGATEIDADPPA